MKSFHYVDTDGETVYCTDFSFHGHKIELRKYGSALSSWLYRVDGGFQRYTTWRSKTVAVAMIKYMIRERIAG